MKKALEHCKTVRIQDINVSEVYRIALILRGSKISRIAGFKSLVEIISPMRGA